MNITPLWLGGVPLHPVSVMGRYLPLAWQDANARVVQRLAFGDLTRLGYPRSALGAFTRAATDGVTVAVDDGFVRALKAFAFTLRSRFVPASRSSSGDHRPVRLAAGRPRRIVRSAGSAPGMSKARAVANGDCHRTFSEGRPTPARAAARTHGPDAAGCASVRASSSAETSAASAAPIRWNISSACRRRTPACVAWPTVRAQRPRPASA